MRVFILTLGTRGDLEPFWALGRALHARGHAVTIGTSTFNFQNDPAIRWVGIGNSSLNQFKAFLRGLETEPDRTARNNAFGRQWAMPQVQQSREVISREAGQHDYFMSNMKFPLVRNGQVIPGAFVTYDPPAHSLDPLMNGSHLHGGRTLELVAMNRLLVDPERAWAEHFHFTGFWAPPGRNAVRPFDVEKFIQAGTKPVVLTMGSMVMFNHQRLSSIFLEALQLTGLRGVVVGGWSDQTPGLHPSRQMITVNEADYSWLFNQVAAVIHHGGVGTVASVLRAGVPSILLPQIPSQERWADILRRDGLCAGVLDTASLTTSDLASAMQRAVQDQTLQEQAACWRERLSVDEGVDAAVRLIEEHWATLNR